MFEKKVLTLSLQFNRQWFVFIGHLACLLHTKSFFLDQSSTKKMVEEIWKVLQAWNPQLLFISAYITYTTIFFIWVQSEMCIKFNFLIHHQIMEFTHRSYLILFSKLSKNWIWLLPHARGWCPKMLGKYSLRSNLSPENKLRSTHFFIFKQMHC